LELLLLLLLLLHLELLLLLELLEKQYRCWRRVARGGQRGREERRPPGRRATSSSGWIQSQTLTDRNCPGPAFSFLFEFGELQLANCT
jgi:hypothetical protein